MAAELRPLIGGAVRGTVLALGEPLSFWGGLDPEGGTIIDSRHPQLGASVRGKVLVMPHGRGSSSASSVLAEAIRLGTAPAAIVLGEIDEIVVLGAMVAAELYDIVCPVLVAPPQTYRQIAAATEVEIGADGTVGFP